MTDTEAKALALELRTHARGLYADMTQSRLWSVLVLAADHIENIPATEAGHAAELREQAERFDAFRQKVSDAVEGFWNYCRTTNTPFPADLNPFILPKPDPLVETLEAAVKAYIAERGIEAFKALPFFGSTKPDPLVEVLKEADAPLLGDDGYEAMAERVHAAMQTRGYEWRKIGEAVE